MSATGLTRFSNNIAVAPCKPGDPTGYITTSIQNALTNKRHVKLDIPGTYYINSGLSIPSSTVLEICSGVTLRAHSSFTGVLITSTSTSNVKLTGDGVIVCTAATAPTFTSVTGLTVDARIEDSSGTPLPWLGSGNSVVQFRGQNGRILYPSTSNMVRQQLKKWSAALANVQAGAANARIAFVGDSIWLGAYATGVIWADNQPFCMAKLIANLLNARGITAITDNLFGDGNMSGANLALYDTRVTPGTWTAASIAGILGGRTISSTTASTASFDLVIANTIDTIETWTVTNPSYQDFEVAVDAGATISTVDASQATSILKTTSACSSGAHTVNIRKSAANAAHTGILGINCFNSAVKAVQCWNMGYGSMTSTLLGTATSVWLPPPMIVTYAPHLTVIMMGINDWAASVSAATFTTNMQTFITAALTVGDVIIVTPPPSNIGYSGITQAEMDALVNALFALAGTNNVPIVDVFGRLVSYTDGNDLGFYGDDVHLDKTGYYDVANALYQFIAQ